MLFNRQEHVLQRVPTDLGGTFSFEDLLPDIYSIRVSFATFVPAIRDRVQVKPGMRSLLEVNLSRVFSSVQVVSSVPAPGGLMNDDWKWTLRSRRLDAAGFLRMFLGSRKPGESCWRQHQQNRGLQRFTRHGPNLGERRRAVHG